MSHRVELPLTNPIYETYHHQGSSTAIIVNNPSIRNWYLNEIIIPFCSKRFLSGYTTPELSIMNSSWSENPHIEKNIYSMQFTKGCTNRIIQEFINNGYYVYFTGVDDYCIEGKSWYKERHFSHNGMICGYDNKDKTYCIYAYDKNWRYQKFWTPQKGFDAGRKACSEKGDYGIIAGIKPKDILVEFKPEVALTKIKSYLNSSMKVYPTKTPGSVNGIAVHNYIAMYVNKLYDGSIPYEKMDRRVFRVIWEHKKVMLECLQKIECSLKLDSKTSASYKNIVSEADRLRMLYASHHMHRRDSILPIIHDNLITLVKRERQILRHFINKAESVMKK